VRDGEYEFAGARQQLALSEPGKRNAIHGLVRWVNWTCANYRPDRVVMSYVLHPQPGYPHSLALSVAYHLDERGLSVEITAENVGVSACPFGAGAHPYLRPVSPKVDDTVLRAPGSTRLLVDERGIPTTSEPVEGTAFDFRAPRPVGDLELDTAYSDLERGADGLARVEFGGTTLWVDEHFTHLMLFSGDPLPDVARCALAVEPMTCAPNAFQSGEGLLTLAPEESFVARWGIQPA
jgi:aldose 1-epimerase